jgi:hypothetical protein
MLINWTKTNIINKTRKILLDSRKEFGLEACAEITKHMRVYPKVSGLAAWSENCKWYSSLPLGAVVFCESK